MNYVKSKLKNLMSLKLLNAILAIKIGLIRVGKCCSTYDLPFYVLKEIATLAAYQSQPQHLVTTVNHVKNNEENFEKLFCF